MEAQLLTIEKYHNVLKDVSMHNTITAKKLRAILSNHSANSSLYTYMNKAGYISRMDVGKYKVNLKYPEPIHARILLTSSNEAVSKSSKSRGNYNQEVLNIMKANPNKNYKEIAKIVMKEYPGKYTETCGAYRGVRRVMKSVNATKPQTEFKYTGEQPKGLNYNPQVDVGKQIKPSAFDLLQTDIRVKELDNRLFLIEAQAERHNNRIRALENNTFLQTAPKPKPSIRQRIASAWNKFIQSLTIKS